MEDLSSLSARHIEAEARRLERHDPEEAAKLYAAAAQQYKQGCERPFDASKYIQCGRKGRLDAQTLLEDARRLIVDHSEDPWVRQSRAWLCYDISMNAGYLGRIDEAFDALLEACEDIPYIKDPSLLCERLVCSATRAIKLAAEINAELHQTAIHRAAELFERRGEDLRRFSKNSFEPGRKSPREIVDFLARKAFSETKDWRRLENWMTRALDEYPKNEWFAEALVRAMRELGDLEDGLKKAEDLLAGPLSNSWPVATAAAQCALDLSDSERAVSLLEPRCRASNQPWPWRKLAELKLENNDFEGAIAALAFGLASARPDDIPKVWGFHHERCKIALRMGDKETAAKELWLGLEARKRGGWEPKNEQRELATSAGLEQEAIFLQMCEAPDGVSRREAQREYRRMRDETTASNADECVVTHIAQDGRFGFAKRKADGVSVFLKKQLFDGRSLSVGQTVRVVCVSSFDKKKNKPGLAAAKIWDDESFAPARQSS